MPRIGGLRIANGALSSAIQGNLKNNSKALLTSETFDGPRSLMEALPAFSPSGTVGFFYCTGSPDRLKIVPRLPIMDGKM